ncbi:MAG TPA: hypothetical protein VF511_04280 [Chthoniobacterales bacterium]
MPPTPQPATRAEAEELARTLPLDQINPADPLIVSLGAELAFMERLRREAPVHFGRSPVFGTYWSLLRYDDIMAVDKDRTFLKAGGVLTTTSSTATSNWRCRT